MKKYFQLIIALFFFISVNSQITDMGSNLTTKSTSDYESKMSIDGKTNDQIGKNSILINNEIIILDSSISQRINDITNELELLTKRTYKYNADGFKTEYITHAWISEDEGWLNKMKNEWTINDDSTFIEKFVFKWDTTSEEWLSSQKYSTHILQKQDSTILYNLDESTNSWIEQYKQIENYDDDDYSINYIQYKWDNSSWVNNMRERSEFDANHNILDYCMESWSNFESEWRILWGAEKKYDSVNHIIQHNQYLSGSSIVEKEYDFKVYLNYDSRGYKTSEYFYKCSPDNQEGWLVSKYEYDNDSAPEYIIRYLYSWDTTTKVWSTSNKTDYTYTIEGDETSQIVSKWSDSVFVNQRKWEYEFDNYGNLTYYNFSPWDENSKQWILNSETNYYYSALKPSGLIDIDINNSCVVYPNPANEYFFLDLQENLQNTSFQLFNMQGQLVLTKLISENFSLINIENLNRGIYLWKFQQGNEFYSGRIVKN